MKKQMINAAKMNQMEFENSKKMMELTNLIHKVNSGNRKYSVNLNYVSRHLLAKTLSEMRKMISLEGSIPKNFNLFVEYINNSVKNKEIKLSFDEMEFLKKFLSLTILQQESVELSWYAFFSRFMNYASKLQYQEIVKKLKI